MTAIASGESTKAHGRVLVIDDDDAIRRVCARMLGREGWEVELAEHARAGIDLLARGAQRFDCVLADVLMPNIDGYELVAAIHEMDRAMPVLLMTGDPSLQGAVRAIDHGAVSYIMKPFDRAALTQAVTRATRRHGVTRVQHEDASARRAAADRIAVAIGFARAIERSWMAFQPIIYAASGRVFAYEALMRTDEESLQRPDLLIATAERLDRVHLLGRTVRANVARAIADAPAEATIFVNVHGIELTDEELFSTSAPLSQHAHRVVLELTERTSIDSAGPARVAQLRKLGYRIAVDDLGAGYAALGALATLEPEIVKLDMSLIRDIDRHATKRRVVGAITTLCHELGARIVAEGVETEAERTTCIDAGIDLLQGYLFARPERGFRSRS